MVIDSHVLCIVVSIAIFHNNGVYTKSVFDIEYGSHDTWSKHPWDLHPILEEQYYNTINILLAELEKNEKLKRQKRYVGEDIGFIIEPIKLENLSKNSTAPVCTAKINGEKHILVEDNIFRVHEHEDGNIFVEFETLLPILEPVMVLESVEYKDSTMILMGYNNHSEVYRLSHTANRDWKLAKLLQTLSNESSKPTAAKFIQHHNQLYLIIIYNRTVQIVNSIMYLWTGTHFDEYYEFSADRAIDLAVIDKDTYYLIMIAQVNSCDVYKFSPHSGVKKLYPIATNGGYKVITYTFEDLNQVYALVINKNAESTVFRLIEDEFVPSYATYDFKKVTSVSVASVEGRTLVLMGSENVLFIYKTKLDGLELLYEIPIHGCNEILSIDYIDVVTGNHALLLTTRSHVSIDAITMQFSLELNPIVSESEMANPFQCLSDIEAILDERKYSVDEIASQVERIMTRDGALVDGVLRVDRDVKLVNSKVGVININPDEKLAVNTKDLLETAAAVDEVIRGLEEQIANVIVKNEPIEIKGVLEIDGDLTVEHLTAEYLNVDSINGKPFKSTSFIYNNGTQYIPNHWLDDKNITVKNLTAPLFKTYLSSAPVFQSLKADNIYLVNKKSINDIDLDSIVLKGYEGTIMGTKTFDRLTTLDVETERLGKDRLTPWIERSLHDEPLVKNLRVQDNLTVSHLFAKRINGINVTDLMDSTFQRGTHTGIKGNLNFVSGLSVHHLETDKLHDVNVDEFMTKTTKQVVNSSLNVRNVLSKSIVAETINGLDIGRDVAIIGRHNAIRSPTTIFNLDVLGNLHLNCGTNDQNGRVCNVIPTKQEDLLQIYNGPVVIVGTLRVPELKFSKHARMRIDGQPFRTDVESQFWMKDISQIISGNVTFTKGISVPQVSTVVINDQATEEIYSIANDERHVSLMMRNVEVRNNIKIPKDSGCSAIRDISEGAVRTTGVYHIKGKKTFSGTLKIGNLLTDHVNDLDMKSVVSKKNQRTQFSGDVRVKTMRVKGDLKANTNFDANYINGYNLSDIYLKALKINEPIVLNKAQFKNIKVENLEVQRGELYDVAASLQGTLSGIHVYVAGDAHIREMKDVKEINEIDFDEYISRVVLKDEPSRVMYGNKYFKSDMAVNKDFQCSDVNGIPLRRLFDEALTLSGDQVVTGKHYVQNVYADSINVDQINGIYAEQMIDTTFPNIFLDGNVVLDHVAVFGNAVGELVSPCDLDEAVKSFGTFPARDWGKVAVDGDVYWDYGGGNISRILEKAVVRNKDVVVNAEVILEGLVSVDKLHTDIYINDVDIDFILKDSLKKHSETPQIIAGEKVIKNDLHVNLAEINRLYSEKLDGIDILEFNKSLVRKDGDYIINGPKVIEADVEVKNLMISDGIIQDVPISDIVIKGDERIIEEVKFESISIDGNLNVDNINNDNIHDFFEDIIKLRGPEQHVYENVVFEALDIDECRVDSINYVPFEELVVDAGHEPVHVHGDKVFVQHVDVLGPARVQVINGHDVQKTFAETVFAQSDVDLFANLTFSAPVTFHGDLQPSGLVNKIKLRDAMDQGIYSLEQSKRESDLIVQTIKYNLDQLAETVKDISIDLLYVEEINAVDLKLHEFRKSYIQNYADISELDIHGYNTGDLCNMPSYCLCPEHYKVTVLRDGSTYIDTKTRAPNRIFRLLSSVDIITTSTSISKDCSVSAIAEYTIISWKNEQGFEESFTELNEYITGYISDIKSFYNNDQHYIIISQYYDRNMDSYNIDTIVLRLDIRYKSVTLIQRIPSKGAWILEIFHQYDKPPILIIGNSYDSFEQSTEVDSLILRFNNITLQFDTLQRLKTIGSRSLASATVRDGIGFIFFAQSGNNPLLIAKYDEILDKFNVYQSFSYGIDVKSIAVSYIENRNVRRPFLCAATGDDKLYIYQYSFTEGWKIHTSGYFAGVQGVIPYSIGLDQYLLAVSANESKILAMVALGIF